MSELISSIKNIVENYDDILIKNIKTSNKEIKPICERAENALKGIDALKKFKNIKIQAAKGQGNLPKNPIFYFLDQRETKTGTEGIYVAVFVISDPNSEDYGSIRLSLTQGVSRIIKFFSSEKRAKPYLKRNAIKVSEDYCSSLKDNNFELAFEASDTKTYARIAHKIFSHASESMRTEFENDLVSVLQVYEEIVSLKHPFNRLDEDDDRVIGEISRRRGQAAFRKALLDKYSKCLVTGSECEYVLEAAHIVPHVEKTNYSADNGLLLRADIHTLYDLNKIGIDNLGIIHVSPELIDSEYYIYDGAKAIKQISAELSYNLKIRQESFDILAII
jgi:hypothetical protein